MVVILIPAYNPDETLVGLVKNLIRSGLTHVVVVNDGSKETCECTFEQLDKLMEGDVWVLKHCTNLGKGRAIKTGINFVANHYPDCMGVITVDADGQHGLDDIRKMSQVLMEKYKEDNIILGCRFGKNNMTKVPLRSQIGNGCTKYILRYLCNLNVSDSQTGLRAIPAKLFPKLVKIKGEGYEYETNMLLDLIDENIEIVEVPITTIYEENNPTSHFNPVKDSLKIYSVIIKYSIASILSAVVDNLTFILLLPHCRNIWTLTFAGRAIAAIFNFSVNKKVVFKKRGNAWRQGIKYIMLLVISGTTSAILVQILQNILHINIIILKMLVEMALYFVNFYIQKNFIFISKEKKE